MRLCMDAGHGFVISDRSFTSRILNFYWKFMEMIYQAFMEKRLRRLAFMLFLLVLCMLSAVLLFALMVTAFNTSGIGALSIPVAFACAIVFEVVRYYFYRSFFLQQLARFAAWSIAMNRGKE